MSLNYDLRNVPKANWQDADGNMSDATESIIFATIPVQIGAITEENWIEFYVRYKTHCGMRGYGEALFFTPEDVRKHIGLTTNVFPEASREEWLKNIVSYMMDQEVTKLKSIDRYKPVESQEGPSCGHAD